MDRNDPWRTEDPLGEALHFLRMSGTFYCRSELTAPWGLALPPMHGCLWFHVVTVGGCWLEVEGAQTRWLEPGAIALVPHGEGHRLRSAPGVPAPTIHGLQREHVSPRYEILRHGEGGDATSLACGGVSFNDPAAHKPRQAPTEDHVRRGVGLAPDADAKDARAHRRGGPRAAPAGAVVITRLSDILVVQAIRSWIETAPAAQTGWLRALQDRQIGRAISLIHRNPARTWTVASLAGELAMSRSAFAARFTELVNEPVMHYVTRWRMQVALNWLEEDSATVVDLANRLGYQSEAAFSRAFKRTTGVSPGAARRNGNPISF